MEQVESIIRQEIISGGSISFARFMELALYCPKIGYYERDGAIGREGDFYTSVSTGPLFGELLAQQFVEWLSKLGPGELTVVEVGAHDGQLASDILRPLGKLRRGLPLKFAIVEPSEGRRAVQQAKLAVFAGQVSWFASLDALPDPVSGIIFSNELLDAMPVYVLQWQRGKWIELRVALRGDSFVWQPVELNTDIGQPTVAPELAAVLPDGFQIEISPAARRWWRTAAARLARGQLVTIDYGFEHDEFFAPQSAAGTLRAYYRHHLTTDVLARPGEQDITAHVNFSEIKAAGELCGLRTEGLVTQTHFLTGMTAKIFDWSSERVRQFQTLTHPEHLGRSFKVLIQSR